MNPKTSTANADRWCYTRTIGLFLAIIVLAWSQIMDGA